MENRLKSDVKESARERGGEREKLYVLMWM